MMALNRRE